jgi:hypothetical protein
MTIECKHACEQSNESRITVDRTLTPYKDGLKFCGICNVWYITSVDVLDKVFPEQIRNKINNFKTLQLQILEWFQFHPNKCPCCGTKLRRKPRRHTERSASAVRY